MQINVESQKKKQTARYNNNLCGNGFKFIFQKNGLKLNNFDLFLETKKQPRIITIA